MNGKLPGARVPEGSYMAQGFGFHAILVIPTFKLVIVHRTNTDLPGPFVSAKEFGELVRLILEARPRSGG